MVSTECEFPANEVTPEMASELHHGKQFTECYTVVLLLSTDASACVYNHLLCPIGLEL